MEGFLEEGTLSSLQTAFSRQFPHRKVYVQHKMEEQARQLRQLILQ
jgi:sulfite reductase alpha subunit-like flavoprotein